MNIPTRIKELRVSMGMSSKELSNKTGIPYDSIKNYEYGRRKPTAKALSKLERFFGVTGSYLLGETDTKEPIYIWQNEEIMQAVNESLPNLIEKLLKTALNSSDMEQKMLFDILIELLHVTSLKKVSPEFKTYSISLMEETFVITTRFIDLCSRVSPEFEDNRIEKSKNSCIEDFKNALSNAQIFLAK